MLFGVFALVGLQLLLAQYLQLVLGDSEVRAALRMLPLVLMCGAIAVAAVVVFRRGLRATLPRLPR